MIFHVPDGLERDISQRHISRAVARERYYDALEWLFTAPDYVRGFN
jgi:hypothetical protein